MSLMLTKNFSQKEFECPCCGQLVIEQGLLDKIQTIRDLMERPLLITSGYRCAEYNESIGGATLSQHRLGRACDISTKDWGGWTLYKFLKLAIKYDLSVGIYDQHLHVDNRITDPVLFKG